MVEMESVPEITIFWLQMIVKSGPDIFLKFLYVGNQTNHLLIKRPRIVISGADFILNMWTMYTMDC